MNKTNLANESISELEKLRDENKVLKERNETFFEQIQKLEEELHSAERLRQMLTAEKSGMERALSLLAGTKGIV